MAASNPSTFNFVFTGTTDDKASAVYTSIRSSSDNFEDEQTFKEYLTKVKESSGSTQHPGPLENAKSEDHKSKFTDIKRKITADSYNTLAAINYTSNNVTTMSFALEATASNYRRNVTRVKGIPSPELASLIELEKDAARNMYIGRHSGGGTIQETLQKKAREDWNRFASKSSAHGTFLGGDGVLSILDQPVNTAYGNTFTAIGDDYRRPNVYFGGDGHSPNVGTTNLSPTTYMITTESAYYTQRCEYETTVGQSQQPTSINVQVAQAPATMGTDFRNEFMNNLFDPTPTAPGQLISMDGKTLEVLTTNSSNNASSTTP